MKSRFTITELAFRSRLPGTTIRYYEKIGLLKPKERNSSGYRIFDEQSLKNVRLIKIAQDSGLSLNDIKTMVATKGDLKSVCSQVQSTIKNRLDDVVNKANEILKKKAALKKALKECESLGKNDLCLILQDCDCK